MEGGGSRILLLQPAPLPKWRETEGALLLIFTRMINIYAKSTQYVVEHGYNDV